VVSQQGVGQGPCVHGIVYVPSIGIVHSDIQEVCRCSRMVTALVMKCTAGRNCSNDFLLDAKHLSAVEKSAFAAVSTGE